MNKTVSEKYSDIGRKLDDYDKLAELTNGLAMSLGLAGTKVDWEGRVSDRLKSVLSKTLSVWTLDRIDSELLKVEEE